MSLLRELRSICALQKFFPPTSWRNKYEIRPSWCLNFSLLGGKPSRISLNFVIEFCTFFIKAMLTLFIPENTICKESQQSSFNSSQKWRIKACWAWSGLFFPNWWINCLFRKLSKKFLVTYVVVNIFVGHKILL